MAAGCSLPKCEEAGIPKGVFNVIHRSLRACAREMGMTKMDREPAGQGASPFTGSTPVVPDAAKAGSASEKMLRSSWAARQADRAGRRR